MRLLLMIAVLVLAAAQAVAQSHSRAIGVASWYGEERRGQVMANGKPFDPDRLTAASWFYPLGSRVRVVLSARGHLPHSVLVTITDRGPAPEFVRVGRIIDLSHAAFKRLAPAEQGLVAVVVRPNT